MQVTKHFSHADKCPQFIVSKIVIENNGEVKKYPCNPYGAISSHKDPANWMKLEDAVQRVKELGEGYYLGFSITAQSGKALIDIDHAYDGSSWSTLAQRIFSEFKGAYVEVSQSGTGLHIIGHVDELLEHRNKNKEFNIELYTHDRFVLLTGTNAIGDWGYNITQPLKNLVEFAFQPKSEEKEDDLLPIESDIEIADEEIIRRARNAPNARKAFGGGADFSDLYDGNEEVLIRSYPTKSEGKLYDRSGADQALANYLAFQGANEDQIIRIMYTSALAREKWDQHKTYLRVTATNAITRRQSMQVTKHGNNNDSKDVCQEILSDMPTEFEGCYYVISEREIYIPAYGLVSQEGFNLCFGAPHLKDPPYKTFKNNARASQRIVDLLGFRPDLPPGAIVEREGMKSLNTYKPIKIKMQSGDMSPFFKFFNVLFPDERDRRILLSYAAVLAQKPGVKSQWAPVLQGVQGCGKSLFADFVAYACGEVYTHRAKGDEFENRFNSQWFGKTLILIEDPNLKNDKLEEILKSLITSRTLCFEGKGKNARMGDFPANFILTVNDFELVHKRKDTRRIAAFMSPLQTPEDKLKAGLTDEIFSGIAKWRDRIGYEIFAHYIHNYVPDPEFDFSGVCVTAPNTSSTEQAIESSRSDIELIILEEIERGRVGFKNGWISSIALTDLVTSRSIRALLPDRKRGEILKHLGYILHPALKEGRAIRPLEPGNGRPALYVHKNNKSISVTDREKIMQMYESDQKII